MPNYSLSDILDNPNNTQHLYGYCGKIVRINLTTREISYLDTYQYVPKYVGGRMVINRIFWDEVPAGTGAFDEENKFIYMNGPTTGLESRPAAAARPAVWVRQTIPNSSVGATSAAGLQQSSNMRATMALSLREKRTRRFISKLKMTRLRFYRQTICGVACPPGPGGVGAEIRP